MLAVLAGLLLLDGQMQAAAKTPLYKYSDLEPVNTYVLRGSFKVRGRCIATDGDYLYESSVRALYKYDKNVRLIAKNEKPFDGYAPAASYLGDIDVFGDELFVSFGNIRKGMGGDIRIVVYDANTLQFKRVFKSNPALNLTHIPSICINRDKRTLLIHSYARAS